ncbi:MAG: tRNA lysidine(34) synthetase TilS [Rhodobacterales bacterium]|nr:MAG: tRNA lysidine(34) synthetase TilS [Rhodobacterales bacterium]
MRLTPADRPLFQAVGAALNPYPGGPLGVAVSGGSDSCALLHLLHLWGREQGVEIEAVTVDHGLREGSADEARMVGQICAALGIKHSILHWSGWDGRGNLQDQARRARYRLMADWAKARGIAHVALGHTLDDQAETVLLRLARGSGVDGLSGMAPVSTAAGIVWHRPLLSLQRQELRDFLTRHGVCWVEDPSNDDPRFDRVKMRQALELLAPLGIDRQRLAATAQALQPARQALELQTQAAAQPLVRLQHGDVLIGQSGFAALPAEIQARLLIHALRWVSRSDYPPRRRAVLQLLADIGAGKAGSLQGCLIRPQRGDIHICREYQAVRDVQCPVEALWDQRWRVEGPFAPGLSIRALGEEGLRQCPNWRDSDVPRASLLASPAIWQNQTLIAAPLAKNRNGWRCSLQFDCADFISSILSH